MNWNPGDKARIKNVPHLYVNNKEVNHFRGEIVYITSAPYYDWEFISTVVDIEPLGDAFQADVRVLEPIDDGNEKCSWEDCVWQPKEIFNETW